MKATIEQIDQMLQTLAKRRATLPEYSFFGDNNWQAIDGQIEVMKAARNGDYPTRDALYSMNEAQYQAGDWLLDPMASDFAEEIDD